MDVEQLQATRRLLSHGAAAAATSPISSPGPGAAGQAAEGGTPAAPFSSLDATVITILSLILCALILTLVLHAALRCAFRVTRRVCYGQEPSSAEVSRERAVQGGRGAIRALPTLVYSAGVELAGCGSTECAICLAEFAQGELVRVLPRCNHGFHVRCIDRWLAARQTCPTCRREPFVKPALPTRGEALVPAGVQLQTHVEAGQPETL